MKLIRHSNMFNLHSAFGFCSKDSYTITTYKQEIQIKRSELPPEALLNIRFGETALFKVYTIYHSVVGFNYQDYDKFIAKFYRNLTLLEKVTKPTRVYIFRRLMRNAIRAFPMLSVWWCHLFNRHYIAAIEILKELGDDKCAMCTRKIVTDFMTLVEAFLLENPDIVFGFPLEYFEYFSRKFPDQMVSFALKRSRSDWVSKEMIKIIRNSRPLVRVREISKIFKNLPFAICKLIGEYVYKEEPDGETFLEYFNKIYDFRENKARSNTNVKMIKRNIGYPNLDMFCIQILKYQN